MLRFGIDDTDSPRGGCTTHALTELLAVAGAHGLDLIGEPRLVRLNPNVPWKTRGNAALSATLGRGHGPRRRLGSIAGRPIWSYGRGRGAPRAREAEFVEAAWQCLRRLAPSEEPGTDPALVVSRRALPAALYWSAVREIVPVADVRAVLARAGAESRTRGSDRGLVGAAAAVAWPGSHPTWELLAYRAPGRIGSARRVDRASVRRAQRDHPELFLCEDRATRRLLVAPHTRCPILYGLRATTPGAALAARRTVVAEPVDRWLLFRTNQGTGDHLRPRAIAELGPYRSGVVAAEVVGFPSTLPGGHVRLEIEDERGDRAPCVAFEPTKVLPRVAAALRAGDRLRVWGSRAADPTLRLEGIEVVRLVPGPGLRRAPRCGACGRRAHSLGRGRGFRCPACRRRWPPEAASVLPTARAVRPGVYHPTPSARRHLAPRGPESRPLARSESF